MYLSMNFLRLAMGMKQYYKKLRDLCFMKNNERKCLKVAMSHVCSDDV